MHAPAPQAMVKSTVAFLKRGFKASAATHAKTTSSESSVGTGRNGVWIEIWALYCQLRKYNSVKCLKVNIGRFHMSRTRDAVSCQGIIYSVDAWRIVYDYITKKLPPDARFERRMRALGVSRSDAYALYRTQLHTPWKVEFIRRVPSEKKQRLEAAVYTTASR